MLRTLVLSGAAALSLAAGAPVLAQPAMPAPASTPAPSTADFITAAIQTDDYERQAGRIAQTSGRTADVRSFGAMMVTDHTKTTEDLKAAIQQAGLAVPNPRLSNDEAQMLNALRLSIGQPTFDATYMDQQVKVHQKALALMQAYSQGGQNALLRNAATTTIPTVERHLNLAQEIRKNLR